MTDILIISPHLDDAVLSLGSFIWENAQQGKNVKVITVFTNGDSTSNHTERKANDASALNRLGASFTHLDFTDAPFRNSAYNSFATIMFHHEKTHKSQLHQQLFDVLHNIILKEQPNQCFFPLGIGGHVDHNVVYHVGAELSENKVTKCFFYEDIPYNLVTNWTGIRFAKLFGNTPIAVQNHTELKKQPYPFLQNYLTNKTDVEQSENCYQLEFNFYKTKPLSNALGFFKTIILIQKNIKQEALKEYITEYRTLLGNHADQMLNDESYWKLF